MNGRIQLPSGFGILLVVIGIVLVVIGFGTISDCSSTFPGANCWDPSKQPFDFGHDYSGGILAFYAGAIMAVIGAVLVLGPLVGRRLGWGFAKGP